MNLKRTFFVIVLLSVLLSLALPCTAYTFPKSFWPMQEGYNAAVEAGDDAGIIKYGTQEYELLSGEEMNSDVLQVLASRTYEVAKSYEKLGDFESSALWFERSIYPNEALGFDDAVKIAKEKSSQFATDIRLYKQTYDTQISYGAKNEHDIGTLCGITYDSPNRERLSNESMTIIYHLYGDEFNGYSESFLKQAAKENKAVEIALNLPGEGADIGMINLSSAKIEEFVDIISKYDNIPIYLRFGGEVNVWSLKPNAEDYKNAFRKVANIVRSKSDNIAMVFGLNFVSDWNSDLMQYYPGDEYVDWVGVSLYCNKYHIGVRAESEEQKLNEIMFFAGNSADPVYMMRDIVNTFGDRKPIMVFESGATEYTVTLDEHSEEWAKNRVRKILGYLPMVYPQIKMIGYFDTYFYPEANDYSLQNCPGLYACYDAIITRLPFIKGSYDNDNAVSYINCDGGFTVEPTVETLGVFAHIYGSEYESVNFFVDGAWAGSSSIVPYDFSYDFSCLSPGAHTLTYIVDAQNGKRYERSVVFYVNERIKINVLGNELQGLDMPPVIIGGRTLVPVRALYEAIGASVEWDAITQTVTATKGKDVVKMKIGSKTIYKNGSAIATDVSPKIINNRTCIPSRIAAELFDLKVGWDAETRTVIIEK